MEKLGLINQKPKYDIALYNKSKSKLDKLIKNGYNVIDEEMWIETDINKNKEEYEAQIRIDKWMKETDKEIQKEILEELANQHYPDDPMLLFDNYILKGAFSERVITRDAKETIELMNDFIINSKNT